MGTLNLFANDQLVNERGEINFTDSSGAVTSKEINICATWLAITQNLHLFQFELSNIAGLPSSIASFSATIPKIVPTYNYILYDAASALVNNSPVLCLIKVVALQGTSLTVTVTFPTPLTNPSTLSMRFLREMI